MAVAVAGNLPKEFPRLLRGLDYTFISPIVGASVDVLCLQIAAGLAGGGQSVWQTSHPFG